MAEELLAFLKNANDSTTENKLSLFLGISEKIILLLFDVESKNKLLEERLNKLESLNKTAVPLVTVPELPPALVPPVNTMRQSIMGELKTLFKKREAVGE